MTARQARRHEERLARKQALKAEKMSPVSQNTAAPAESLQSSPEPIGFVPQLPTRAAINKQNAQHSTGPKTPDGKAASSMNNFRHGLAGQFTVLAWENIDLYHELLTLLQDEHRPETITEHLLVERMAQHQWLSQRAVRLQRFCFHDEVPLCQEEKLLALYLRYQTTHDRAFHKCLADLLKLRAQKSKDQRGFESQQRQQAGERTGRSVAVVRDQNETRKQELHEVRLQSAKSRLIARKPSEKPAAAPVIISAEPHFPLATPDNSLFERKTAA